MGRKNGALSQFVFLLVSMAAGGAVYLFIKKMGTHLVVNDAPLWGVAAAVFIYLSQFLMLSGRMRQARGLTYGTRLTVILVCLFSLAGALVMGTFEIQRGYPILTTDMLSDASAVDGRHFTIEGDVNTERAYRMTGNLGEFYLVPVTDFNHRILMMLSSLPATKRVRATGKLRSDIRTVQKSKSGAVEGPFLRVYREDMLLAENTPILFLDTSNRAGLNFLVVLWFLISLYLFVYFVRAVPTPMNRSKMRFKKG